MDNRIKSAGLFALCFAVSLGFSLGSSEKTNRKPAAADMSADEIKTQLQKKIRVTPTINGTKTISFSGFTSALCKTYSSIEVEFTAEGVAVSGEYPTMQIVTPCEAGLNADEMASINLPIDKILHEKPRNAEFTFAGFHAVVSFKNSADEWPMQWVLKRVEFKNTTGESKAVSFNRAPASFSEPPIVLEF